MKKKLLFLLSLLSVVTIGVASATACDNGKTDSSTPSTGTESDIGGTDSDSPVKATYTVKFVDEDGTELSSATYEEGATVEAPQAPTKESADGYSYTFAGWDKEVTAATEDVTYTATYTKTAIEYTITFMDGEEVVETVTFTVETTEIQAPAVPAKAGYENGAWGAYDLTKLENQTVTASGYTAIEYTLTFMDGEDVVDTVTFTVETTEIQEPELPTQAHYTSAWGKYDLTKAENQTVAVEYTAIEYKVNFVDDEEMAILPPVKFTIENIDAVEFPEVPADFVKEGYTGEWDITPADLELQDCTAKIKLSPNTYKVIFDANGGACEFTDKEITFDTEYTLPVATTTVARQYFNGWADENGKIVPESGTWSIANNVTLKAIFSNTMSFNDGAVPAAFTKADTTASLDIVSLNGNKVLQLTNSSGSPAMKVTTAWLAEYFNDENVDYIAFDAIADKTNNNFRRDTLRSDGFKADCYEQDMTYTHDADGDGTVESYPTTGIRADAWKTFYFSRADYNAWVAQGVTEARFIASGGFAAGENVYLDNIRPVKAAERTAGIGGFESGGIRINDAGKTLLFYTLDQGTTWQFNMQVSGVFTNVGLTNEKVTDGIAALTFTKPAGNLSINLTDGRAVSDAIVKTTGYWAIDVYVPEDSDASVNFHKTNYNGVTLKKGAWTTIYVADSKNQLVLSDTTGGTYCVDNIRSITADEYALAGLSFEANVGGLRNHELDKVNETTGKNEGVAYYYAGKDYAANKFSFAMGEGNGDADANVLGAVRYDNTIAHSGNYSLAIEKNAGYLYFTMRNDSAAFELLKDGFTFWIYSTVDIDGVNTKNMVNGCNEKFNGGEGIYIPANTWTQITVTAADMNPTRFLILQGDVAGTIYLDDFKPLN